MKTLIVLAILATLAAALLPPPPLSAGSPVVQPAPPRPVPPYWVATPRAEHEHERHEAEAVQAVTVAVGAIDWLDVDYQKGPQ